MNIHNILLIAVTVIAFSIDRAEAHGTPHAGHHPDAVASDCLEPIFGNGTIGFWKNNCPIGVNVHWKTEGGKETGCDSQPYRDKPCAAYVKANSKKTAVIGQNRILWFGCGAATITSGPFPLPKPDNANQNQCRHLGFGYTGWGLKKFDGGRLYGQFSGGKFNGIGMYQWDNGGSYIGEIREGALHGQGTISWASGDVYTGKWENSNRQGITVMKKMEEQAAAAREEQELRELNARLDQYEYERQMLERRRRQPSAWQSFNDMLNDQFNQVIENWDNTTESIPRNTTSSRQPCPPGCYRDGEGWCRRDYYLNGEIVSPVCAADTPATQ